MSTYKNPIILSGAGPLVFTPKILGFKPMMGRLNLQVNAEGLEGGDFDVLLMVPGLKTPVEHQLAANELDSVIIRNDVSFEGVVVKFNNLGGGASPKAVINARLPG